MLKRLTLTKDDIKDKLKRKKKSKKSGKNDENDEGDENDTNNDEEKKRKKSSRSKKDKKDKEKKKSKKSGKSSGTGPETSELESEDPTPASSNVTDSDVEPSTEQSEMTDASEDPKEKKSPESVKEKPKLTFKQERQLGYMPTTGRYNDTDKYCNERYQLSTQSEEGKVAELDTEFKENQKKQSAECRAYPPKRKFKEFFWTTGHYKFWEDIWARVNGLLPDETDATVVADGTNPDGTPIVDQDKKEDDDTNKADTENEKKDAEQNVDSADPTSEGNKKKKSKSKSKSKSLKADMAGPDGEVSTNRLLVGNIPANATQKDLEKLFPKAEKITMVPDPSGSGKMSATIQFKDVKQAFKAYKKSISKNPKIGGIPLVIAPKVKD